MVPLHTRELKAKFLKGLETKKYSIKDLAQNEFFIVLDNEAGGYVCHETGQVFTVDYRQKGIAAGTWIEL